MQGPQQELNLSLNKNSVDTLPPIPDKIYFTIGEVSKLCLLKPHVLRYWEQEFPQLKPAKRRGNRRYYQRNEVVLIRRIKKLLYEQGFTIDGARSQLAEDDGAEITDVKSSQQVIKNIIDQLECVLVDLEYS
jgi:DNA-binding transcriptional MerR regulator